MLLISPPSWQRNADLQGKGLPSRFYITCPYQLPAGLSPQDMRKGTILLGKSLSSQSLLPIRNWLSTPACWSDHVTLRARKRTRKDGEINTTKGGNQGQACVTTCPRSQGTSGQQGRSPPTAGPSPGTWGWLQLQGGAVPSRSQWILLSVFTWQRKGKRLLQRGHCPHSELATEASS